MGLAIPASLVYVEYLAVEINLRSCKILAMVLYRPPNATHDLNLLDEFLADHIALYQHIIVMTDININVLKTTFHPTVRLNGILSTYGFSILQSGPTHHNLNTASTQIDLTFTIQTQRVKLYKQRSVPGILRHDILYLAYSIKVPKYPVQYVRYRDLGRLDEDRLSECLVSVDWTPIMSSDDSVDREVDRFNIYFWVFLIIRVFHPLWRKDAHVHLCHGCHRPLRVVCLLGISCGPNLRGHASLKTE